MPQLILCVCCLQRLGGYQRLGDSKFCDMFPTTVQESKQQLFVPSLIKKDFELLEKIFRISMQSGHELSIRKKYFGQQVDKNSMQTQKCLKIDEL